MVGGELGATGAFLDMDDDEATAIESAMEVETAVIQQVEGDDADGAAPRSQAEGWVWSSGVLGAEQ